MILKKEIIKSLCGLLLVHGGGTLNNRDFVALAIAKTETPQTTATPEPTAEPTEAPTAEPTAEPTEAPTMAPVTIVTAESGMSTSNGGKTADVAFKDITADYTGFIQQYLVRTFQKPELRKWDTSAARAIITQQ